MNIEGKSRFSYTKRDTCSYCKVTYDDIGSHLMNAHFKCKKCGKWSKSEEDHLYPDTNIYRCRRLKYSDVFKVEHKEKSLTIRTIKCISHQGIKLTKREIKECGSCKIVPFMD